jgi:RNAse (barnase) inhibitor barstar
MNQRTLDGQTIRSPEEFYGQFFAIVEGLMPDYGVRNLDALIDDLRELTGPPQTIVWTHAVSRAAPSVSGLAAASRFCWSARWVRQ